MTSLIKSFSHHRNLSNLNALEASLKSAISNKSHFSKENFLNKFQIYHDISTKTDEFEVITRINTLIGSNRTLLTAISSQNFFQLGNLESTLKNAIAKKASLSKADFQGKYDALYAASTTPEEDEVITRINTLITSNRNLFQTTPPAPSSTKTNTIPRSSAQVYDLSDVTHALANAFFIGLTNYASPPVSLSVTALTGAVVLWQNYQIYRMLPQDSHPLRKIISHPLVGASTFLLNYSILSPIRKIHALSQLYPVAKNALPKLYSCASIAKEQPVKAVSAGALHLFNLGYQLVLTANAYREPASTPKNSKKPQTPNTPPQSQQSKPQQSPNASPPKPQQPSSSSTTPEQLEILNKYANPMDTNKKPLNLNKRSDIEKFLEFDNSQKCSPDFFTNCPACLPPEGKCKKACSTVKKIWRELFAKVHEDKHPDHRSLAKQAAHNLGNAKDNLFKHYNCLTPQEFDNSKERTEF